MPIYHRTQISDVEFVTGKSKQYARTHDGSVNLIECENFWLAKGETPVRRFEIQNRRPVTEAEKTPSDDEYRMWQHEDVAEVMDLVIIEYEGAVLAKGEMNGYHDSDFYAIVYDVVEDRLRKVTYDTTRFAGGGHAVIDATEETKAKAEKVLERIFLSSMKYADEQQATKPLCDRLVTVVKGKKVAPGTVGMVRWRGDGHYGPRVRLEVQDSGESVFVNEDYCEVVNPEQYRMSESELQMKAAQAASHRRWRNAMASGYPVV